MSIHTHTNQEQYRHARLNVLATGTIVGAVWALAILRIPSILNISRCRH